MDKHEIEPNGTQADQRKCTKCGSEDVKVLSTKKKLNENGIWTMIACGMMVISGLFASGSDLPIPIPPVIFSFLKVIFLLLGLAGMQHVARNGEKFQVARHNFKCNKCNHEWRSKV